MESEAVQKTRTGIPSAGRPALVPGSAVVTFGILCCAAAMAVVLAIAAAVAI